MYSSNQHYLHNPLIHEPRQLGQSPKPWIQQFNCTDLKPLIICRGPIRKEAMDVFAEMGISNFGILLSEKDSIIYPNALAPELRLLTDHARVHNVPDYSGTSKEERQQRIEQIITIANQYGYNSIFAGYGFMAEDEAMVSAMEQAGLNFIGPCSGTVHRAGLKDEAKRTALEVGVSVTPGINNVTTQTLLSLHPTIKDLQKLCQQQQLNMVIDASKATLEEFADAVLTASYQKGIDLFSMADLSTCLQQQVASMYTGYPNNRIRLKAIAGGGGKGQRILPAPSSFKGSIEEQIQQAIQQVPDLANEILAEVKCNGVGDNKNILAELNIETTRHQEIQVVGNGNWCITMGGRDCSLQMHEQKLLEVSVTIEELQLAISAAQQQSHSKEAETLTKDLNILMKMEDEAALFGQAVGLDSVSTFECIVDGDNHFFMEMNTRIQVEHRVTELCYKLRFSNPDNADEYFDVNSLVEMMVLLARHGDQLPKPQRIKRQATAVEARLNATNHALQPHAGGTIEYWSNSLAWEIRDDQGICVHNPDTDVFMSYHLAGAYDSNIALLLTTGIDRNESYQRLAEILRCSEINGNDLSTNIEFHYGLVNWFIGNNIHARPSTGFILPYLTLVGKIQHLANQIDLSSIYRQLSKLTAASQTEPHDWLAAFNHKQNLVLRPIQQILGSPHHLAGWLSLNQQILDKNNNWLVNPLSLIQSLYHYLNMDYIAHKPAANMIWQHDHQLLCEGLAFYEALQQHLAIGDYSQLDSAIKSLSSNSLSPNTLPVDVEQIQAAHTGFQAGTDLLKILPYIAEQTAFYQLSVNADLSIQIPDSLTDQKTQQVMLKELAPPPAASSNEILALSGGMFYSRNAPGMPVFIEAGQHFEQGQPLYIVEVMKMFNTVKAPFSGTVDKVLIEQDGTIIKKGQPLFLISPDEVVEESSAHSIQQQEQQQTQHFIAWLST